MVLYVASLNNLSNALMILSLSSKGMILSSDGSMSNIVQGNRYVQGQVTEEVLHVRIPSFWKEHSFDKTFAKFQDIVNAELQRCKLHRRLYRKHMELLDRQHKGFEARDESIMPPQLLG
jgi:hypothetical protein